MQVHLRMLSLSFYFLGSNKHFFLCRTDGNHLDSMENPYKFFETKFSFWIELLDGTVFTNNRSIVIRPMKRKLLIPSKKKEAVVGIYLLV